MVKIYLCVFLSILIASVSFSQEEQEVAFKNCSGQAVDLEALSNAGKTLFILHLPNDCKNCSLPMTQIETLRNGDGDTRFFLAIPSEQTNLNCNTAKLWLQTKGLSFFSLLKYPDGYNPAPTAALVYTLIRPGDLSDETTAEEIMPDPVVVSPADVAVDTTPVDIGPVEFAINDFYPNPFEDEVTLNFTTPGEEDLVVRVLDIVGNEVYSGAFCVNEEKSEVSFLVGPKDQLNSGVYLLRVELSDQVETIRLFKD
jgi:hypothetical protein